MLQRINFNPLLTVELKKLADQTGEPINFGVADGTEIIYLAGSAAKGILRLEIVPVCASLCIARR